MCGKGRRRREFGRTVGQGVELVGRNGNGRLRLTEQRHDRLTRVAADDGNRDVGRVLFAHHLANEGFGADDVESGDAEELLGVEHTTGLENLGGNGHGRVYRVRDDEDVGFWAVLDAAIDQFAYDAGVDLEEVVAGHARFALEKKKSTSQVRIGNCVWFATLTWDASGNDDKVGTGECLLHAIVWG